MIYEYAIDPEILIDLADKSELCMHLKHYFGCGNTCVIAGYPLNILEEANKIIDAKILSAHSDKQKASLQEKRKRLNNIGAYLIQNCTKRVNIQNSNSSLMLENIRWPFHGIISSNRIYSDLSPISVEDMRSATCSIYGHKRSILVQRSPQKILDAIKPLLLNASQLTFIDPYFYPAYDRFKKTYSLFFKEIASTNCIRVTGIRNVKIICARNDESDYKKIYVTYKEFHKACSDAFRGSLPPDLTLTIYRVKGKIQEIHNRYILSDIGGILLGHGTDCSPSHPSSYDDIALLERDHCAQLNLHYTPNSLYFDWSEKPIEI